MKTIKIKVDAVGIRIDSYISGKIDSLSRNHVQKLIKDGLITVDGNRVKTGYKVNIDEEIVVNIPKPEELDAKPENIPLDIIYEDDDIIVINKGKDMVVHPSKGHPDGTLVNALLYHCSDNLSDINGVLRPGIIHRIDKDTTGLLAVVKNNTAHKRLSEMIKKHEVDRIYYALVRGNIREEEGMIDAPIGRHKKDRKKMAVDAVNGKDAVTYFKVLKRFEEYTYLELKLETGRTHQIRVHLSHIGYPIMGDETYGKKNSGFITEGQVLHAGEMRFKHPAKREKMVFKAPLPEYFTEILDKLSKEKNK